MAARPRRRAGRGLMLAADGLHALRPKQSLNVATQFREMLKIVATNPLGKRYSMLNLPILLSSTRNVGEQVVQQERAFHVANPLCGIGVTGPRCRSAVFG